MVNWRDKMCDDTESALTVQNVRVAPFFDFR